MSERSVYLDLPYIQPAQAQKHVTHNEALRALDAVVQLNVIDADRTAAPAGPQDADRHIVASGATGAWVGQDGMIATYETAGWVFQAPQTGWQALVVAQAAHVYWDGAQWAGVGLGADGLGPIDLLGINTAADTTNRLAVAADATLLTHDGDDHRLTINKAQDTDTASLVFQSGYTGHAEMGLTGGTDFALRVSADGTTFTDALSVDAANGELSAPAGIGFGQSILRHYEEGTWTPRLACGGDDTGMVYSQSVGFFTRIGNLVMLHCAIDLSAKGTGTGAVDILDLPFDANPSYYPGTAVFISGGTSLNVTTCRAISGQRVRLYDSTATGSTNITHSNLTASTNLKISLMHMI